MGVDIFFVISGYLITSLILKDLEQGTFSLLIFLERRIRRIFPALAVMVLASGVVGWFLFLPEDLTKLGQSIVAQALGLSNFYFWRTTSYFGGQNLDKPLLHTWSLAVEEQFYFLFPLLMILVCRHVTSRSKSTLLIVFLIIGVVSLALSAWGVCHQPYATFFLLPTRAWELLCGSIIAVVPCAWKLHRMWVSEAVCFLGLVCILLPIFTYTEQTPFPGLSAFPACLGASLLIWGSRGPDNFRLTWSAHLLASKPVVCIGLISYSLYLWHWPVLVFADYWKSEPFSLLMRAFLFVIALVVAILSWHLIEKPFRKLTGGGKRLRTVLLPTLLCSFLMVIFGAITYFADRVFFRHLSPDAQYILREISVANHRDPYVHWVNTKDVLSGNVPKIGSGMSRQKILLWGDSHAELLTPVLEMVCNELGIAGEVIASYSTPPLVISGFKSRDSLVGTEGIGGAVVNYVGKEKFSDVLIAAYWSKYQKKVGKKKFEDLLNHTIASLQAQGVRVWIIMDPPTYPDNFTRMILQDFVYGAKTEQVWKITSDQHRSMQEVLYRLRDLNTNRNLDFIDPSPPLLSDQEKTYLILLNQTLMYKDGNHLSPKGAEQLFHPLLLRALSASKVTYP